MLALTKVKKNIEFNQRFSSILDVLKSIAVAQFRTLERKLAVFETFDSILESFFSIIDPKSVNHPFLGSEDQTRAVIAVTSDQGLLGGLNVRVVTGALSLVRPGQDQLIIIGEQGKTFARYNQVSFASFPGIQDNVRYQQSLELRNYLFSKIQEGRYLSVHVIYPRALSLASQRIDHAILLPLQGQGAPTEGKKMMLDLNQAILESSLESVLEYLAYLRMGQRLNDIFGLSRLAELGARFSRLEESTQKIQEINKKLKLQYFKLRHEVIDQSMRELFAARALYA